MSVVYVVLDGNVEVAVCNLKQTLVSLKKCVC